MKKTLRSFATLLLVACFIIPLSAQKFRPQSTTHVPLINEPTDDIPLYEQISNPATAGTISQDFTDYPTYSCQAADDFFVPDGTTWLINKIEVGGFYSNGNGPATVVNFFIYQHHETAQGPGEEAITMLAYPVDTSSAVGDLVLLFDQSILLKQGHYWLSIQPVMNAGKGGQWFWRHEEGATLESEFQWRNPGGGFGIQNAATWQPASQINFGDTLTEYNLGFAIYGDWANQIIELKEGWSGVSSYLQPDDPDLENLFSLFPGVIFLFDEDGIFTPGGENNTIQFWDCNKGFAIKMNTENRLLIKGTTPQDNNITLTEGWNMIPVLSKQPVDVSFITGQYPQISAIKEVAGKRIFLRNNNISTLTELLPGKSYYLFADEAFELDFDN
jgi:hypothetical protein